MKQLITIITPGIAEHCVEFKANHAEYAARHGYAYNCYSDLYWPDLAASFSKIGYIRDALGVADNDVVLWADADIAFTNMTVDLADLLKPDYWLAGYAQQNNACVGGRPYICAGLMVIRNDARSQMFFDDVLTTKPIWYNDNINNRIHGWEQFYVDEKFVERNFEGVHCCTTAEIGGFSREFWNDKKPWFPGCPTVHISATGNWPGRRKVLVQKYLPKIVR